MSNSDAVAVLLVAENGVIDAMEASTGVFGYMDLKFLANYQTTLASGPTTLTDDGIFTGMLSRYMNAKKAGLSKLGS